MIQIITLRFPIFILIYCLLSVFVIGFHFYNLKNNKGKYSLFFKLIVTFYLLLLFNTTILGIVIADKEGLKTIKEFGMFSAGNSIQLIPFKTISEIILNINSLKVTFLQIFGNILLILPISMFLYFIKNFSRKRNILSCFLVSFSIEIIQLVMNYITHVPSHVCDIDDIILNMVGAIIGMILVDLIRKNRKLDIKIKEICFITK